MTNCNTSGWVEAGKRTGVDLSCLLFEKEAMYAHLDRLGLPRVKSYSCNPQTLPSDLVEKFNGMVYFCRLIPSDLRLERPWRQPIRAYEELRRFLDEHDLREYRTLQLVEKGNVTHTGGIVATDLEPGVPGPTVIELVRGDGVDLFHGKKTPWHGWIRYTRTLHFDPETPVPERLLMHRALDLVNGVEHPFPGYYEFDVRDENKILFRNYQYPGTVWTNWR